LDFRDRITFVTGVVVRGDRTHPVAPAFVDYFVGSDGQALLSRHGFLPASSVPVPQLPWQRRE
jgi:hypothetical protein